MHRIHHLMNSLHIRVHHGEDLIVFVCLAMMLLGLVLCVVIALVVFFRASTPRDTAAPAPDRADDPSAEQRAGLAVAGLHRPDGRPLLGLVRTSDHGYSSASRHEGRHSRQHTDLQQLG